MPAFTLPRYFWSQLLTAVLLLAIYPAFLLLYALANEGGYTGNNPVFAYLLWGYAAFMVLGFCRVKDPTPRRLAVMQVVGFIVGLGVGGPALSTGLMMFIGLLSPQDSLVACVIWAVLALLLGASSASLFSGRGFLTHTTSRAAHRPCAA